MSKDVQIEWQTVQIPVKIVVDGKEYPQTQRNRSAIIKYDKTKDESALDELSEMVLVF